MRLLHTGDWHVGKTLKGRSRQDEHEAMLAEILDIARRERVDALLIGGDTFDHIAPAPEAERLVYSALAECVGAGIPVVLIGGNHDHPRRLAALTGLLDRLRIFIRPDAGRRTAGSSSCRLATARRWLGSPRCRSCTSRGSSTRADCSIPRSSGIRRTRSASRACWHCSPRGSRRAA